MRLAFFVVLAALAAGCADPDGPEPSDAPLGRADGGGGGGGKADGGGLLVRSWDGPTNVFPAELPEVSANFDANHCELFVNGLGRGNFSNGGASASWIEAWVSVPPQEGEILEVGMFVRTAAGDANYVMLGDLVEPDYWLTGFTTERNFPAESHVAEEVAFFVDREDARGNVVRLWQSASGEDFDVSDTFAGSPSGVVSIGGGSITYANESARVFDQKHACQ
jgi:hypothetical protein